MNSNTQALLQYLGTTIELVESKGVQDETLKIEVINEMITVIEPDDGRTSHSPSGKTMIMMSWKWGE